MTAPGLAVDVCRLDQVATIDREGVAAGAIEHGTTYVGLENIDSDGGFVDVRPVSQGELASNKFRFGPHHILFGKLRPYLRKTARPDFEGVCSTDIVPILPGPRMDRGYLFHFLRHPRTVEQAVMRCEGANLPRLSPKDLASFAVPVPAVAEQRRIADILDKADAIRRKRKQAIALTEELLRSAFLDMFGDPVTNPKRWPVKPLAKLGELDRGRSRHRPRNEPSLLGGKHPLIQTGEIANCDGVIDTYAQTYSDLGLAQSKLWPAGTLCITIAANIAKTGVLAFDACFPDSVVGFTPGDDATTEYVQYWLGFLQPVLERQAPQSAQKNINLEILRTLSVPAPDGDLQRRFSAVVARIREGRNNMRQALSGSETLFQSLVAGAFTGALECAC